MRYEVLVSELQRQISLPVLPVCMLSQTNHPLTVTTYPHQADGGAEAYCS